MARVYVTAIVPAALRPVAEAAVAPYLLSPNDPGVYTFSVPLVPHPGPTDAAATHYGCCAPVDDQGGLYAALPGLSAAVPGTSYRVVSPWRNFDTQADWTDRLQAQGLQTYAAPTTP